MKLLLDTHTVLWFLGGSDRLSAPARAAIEDPANTRFFSVAGAWEIAIKVSLGKLNLLASRSSFPGSCTRTPSTSWPFSPRTWPR